MDKIVILRNYLKELAQDEVRVAEAIDAWRDGRVETLLKESGIEGVTVEDVKAVLRSGDVNFGARLENSNGGCDTPQPTSMGNCVA